MLLFVFYMKLFLSVSKLLFAFEMLFLEVSITNVSLFGLFIGLILLIGILGLEKVPEEISTWSSLHLFLELALNDDILG